MVEKCIPLFIYSQFWVERYIGLTKHLLHVTNRPAESMGERGNMRERVKMYFQEHFVSNTDQYSIDAGETCRDPAHSPSLLFPCDKELLTNPYHYRKQTKKPLKMFTHRAGCPYENEASSAVIADAILGFGSLRLPVGTSSQIIGAIHARWHRGKTLRSDWHIAAEVATDIEKCRDVHYGRVLKWIGSMGY